jgi:hypothetical protein
MRAATAHAHVVSRSETNAAHRDAASSENALRAG